MTASEKLTGSNPKWFKNLRTFGEIGITYNNQKIKGKFENRGYPWLFIGYTEYHASNVYVFFNLNNQAIFMSHNVVWLHKLFHQHMKTKSALIPGFTTYDVTPATNNAPPVLPAVAPTIAPAPIPQRLTRATTPRTFYPPTKSIPSTDEDSDDDDDGSPVPPPTPHAPFDMNDTNAPLTPRLPCELRNLETFYNPKPVDHFLLRVMKLLKMSYLLIHRKKLLQTLKQFMMMLSFVMLIYLNTIVIPSLQLKPY
jgi:hypothetical protein